MKAVHRSLLFTALVAATSACGHAGGRFVWVDALGAAEDEPEYVIVPGDVLSIQVWNDPALTGPARVRSDGRISVAFVDDVDAAGIPPSALARQLEARLAAHILKPRVTVAVEAQRPLKVTVVGQVERPGLYELERGAGVLQGLAIAGGRTRYAHDDRIYVLRDRAPHEEPLRIRFRYDRLSRAEGRAAAFRLRSGDVLVVE
jgi:polysaccharide biosynthesis/export protein